MFRPIGKVRIGIDVAVAVAFLAVTATSEFYVGEGPSFAPLIAVFMSAALAVRRLSPALALGIAWLGAIVQMALLMPPLPTNFAILGVLYVTAAYGSRLVMWLGAASAVLGAITVAAYLFLVGISTTADRLIDAASEASITTIGVVLGFALAWTAGALVRTMFRAREIQDAKRIADAVAQAEQERARIARDMHDVVAHSLAVVVAQANGARYAGRADPQIALDTLGTISQTAGSALADVRVLLAQLRHREAEGPQPSIADIDALFAQIRRAGMDLTIDIDPAPLGDVPAAVQLAVYRILQEALTNGLRHGDGEPVAVSLAWFPRSVRLAVSNPVGGSVRQPASEPGHGIIGMRERASLVGGSLDIDHSADRFTVRAEIPWEAR
ncbi:MAG: sensor histidine kinase [Microbacterium gubbeenense]|uniref:sensor histidine kinase n=1 Tax=Microbacterium gubbeenense TaxID=159896 RepID=UPI003F9AF291